VINFWCRFNDIVVVYVYYIILIIIVAGLPVIFVCTVVVSSRWGSSTGLGHIFVQCTMSQILDHLSFYLSFFSNSDFEMTRQKMFYD